MTTTTCRPSHPIAATEFSDPRGLAVTEQLAAHISTASHPVPVGRCDDEHRR
jgi:hypothetical protein